MAVYLGLVEDNQNYLDEEIEEFFKIIDDDAELKGYSIKQQLKINEFLDSINVIISNEDQEDLDVVETLSLIEIAKKSLSTLSSSLIFFK